MKAEELKVEEKRAAVAGARVAGLSAAIEATRARGTDTESQRAVEQLSLRLPLARYRATGRRNRLPYITACQHETSARASPRAREP